MRFAYYHIKIYDQKYSSLHAIYKQIFGLRNMNGKDLVTLFKMSFKGWKAVNAPLRAAALTFFIILPLPSLLLIIVTIFAQFYGQTQATQQLMQQISSLAGPAVAGLFNEVLSSATSPFTSIWASITVVTFSGRSNWCFCRFARHDGCDMGGKISKKEKLGYKN